MAGASFNITAKLDERQIIKALDQLLERGSRLAPAFKNIGEELLRSTRERFSSQTDPDGRPWEKLKAGTIAAKAARGHSTKILRRRGYLSDTIRCQAGENGVRVGTNRVYGAIHQLGGQTKAHVIRPVKGKALAWPGGRHPVRGVNHPGSKIPARPYLGLSNRDRERVLEIVADHLNDF